MKGRRAVKVSVVPTQKSFGRYSWWAGNNPTEEYHDDALKLLHATVMMRVYIYEQDREA